MILKNSDCSLYADDTTISDTDCELHQAQSKLNNDLDTSGKWLSANKLSANLVKTEYVIIASSVMLKAPDYSPILKLSR